MEQFNQPAPIPNDEPFIQDLVIEDMKARREHGIREYGIGVQIFNKRNSPVDAYEEALDLTNYLKQLVIEREHIIHAFRVIAESAHHALAKLAAIQMLLQMGETYEPGQAERDAEGVAD